MDKTILTLDVDGALSFIKAYTEFFGPEEHYGYPEWEVLPMVPETDRYYPGLFPVICSEPDKVLVQGGTEDIQWIKGYRREEGEPLFGRSWQWWRQPDFAQAYLTPRQIILLAEDLMAEWEDFESTDATSDPN